MSAMLRATLVVLMVLFLISGRSSAAPIQVEVLDDRDQPLAGYAGDAAARVTEDGTRVAVKWASHAELPTDRPVALRIILPDNDAARLQAMMDRSAVRVTDRAAAYRKSGWKAFDPKAAPYNADQVQKERSLYMK